MTRDQHTEKATELIGYVAGCMLGHLKEDAQPNWVYLEKKFITALKAERERALEEAALISDKYPARNTICKHEGQIIADQISYDIRALKNKETV